MFEGAERDDWTDLTAHPVAALASLAEANQAELKERENRVLRIAAAWADAYPGDPRATSPLLERGVQLGGDGTPLVSEFAATELAPTLGKSHGAARALIADALDIRHRLPVLWQLVESARVHGWQARKIAQATRLLSIEAAGEVDQALAGYIGQLGWTRFERLLEAAVLAADPALAEQRTAAARRDRGVWATEAQDGQKTIVARTDSSTATWFMAVINRIADTLATEGDTDTADLRRSKALGWLSQPARALDLLSRHADDVDPTNDLEPEPSDPTASEPRPSAGEEVPDDVDPEHAAHGIDLIPATGLDPKAGRPKVVLHFHLSDTTLRPTGDGCTGVGMVRPEHGGPITVDQLRDFLTGTGCSIKIQPVIDPADTSPIDGYEISHRMRRAVRYRDLADTSPYATSTSMSMDLDHTVPYQSMATGGPPGQTSFTNLAPASRPPHRGKTFHRWFVRQPDPGTHLWRSRFGRVYLVTNHGTLALGNTAFSHALWDLAAPAMA